MPARIDTKFEDGFLLSEEHLTKIEDIIKKRFDFSINEKKLQFEIHRQDDALITYESISDVVSEENSTRNKIKELSIKCENDQDYLHLQFEIGEPTRLNLVTTNRDTALLLTSDIREYLHSEVLKKKFSSFFRIIQDRLFIPMTIMIIFSVTLAIMIIFRRRPDIDLSKSTLDQKINHLILLMKSRDNTIDEIIVPVMPIGFILISILFYIFGKFFYSTDVFYWGKEVQRHDSQQKIKSNVFWSGFVALIVGLLATFIYNGMST